MPRPFTPVAHLPTQYKQNFVSRGSSGLLILRKGLFIMKQVMLGNILAYTSAYVAFKEPCTFERSN